MKNLIKLISVLLFGILSIPTSSQNVLNRAENRSLQTDNRITEVPEEFQGAEQCAFEEIMIRENSFEDAMTLSEREAAFKTFVNSGTYEKLDGVITVIPVVVHIIHLGEAEGVGNNISDAQIQSAITQLNNNFRKVTDTHGDADGVDTEIEFCLASIDPNGNATDGINRVNGSSVAGYSTTGVCVSSSCTQNDLLIKNLSRWPNTQYYNIWVVSEIMGNNGGYGIQGYAYFPGTSSLYDGTVIMNTCFGGIGTVNYWNNMGRTLTHEVGHGMGLYHSFEGDNGGSTCPTGNGDYVLDTDAHKRSSGNCPTSTNTCTATSLQDVVHNYMDYSSQTCADMFSLGQADRMNAQITYWRSSLASSNTCTISDINDLALTRVVNGQDYQCSSSYTPIVNVYNIGSQLIDTITFTYSYDGGTDFTYNWYNTLSVGDSLEIALPMQTLSYAPHTLSINASPSQVDSNLTNNDVSINFETIDEETYSLEVVLDYYGSENSWEVIDDDMNVLAFGGPFQNGQNGLIINDEVCVPSGCNQFVFYESYGDGMESGSYTLSDNLGNEVASGWNSPNASSFPTPMFESTPIGGPATVLSASESIICPGTEVVLTASGGDSYTWSTGQTGTSISVSPNTTTSYSVTASSASCSGNEVMITVEVSSAPVATVSPMNPDVCEGESVTLIASGGSTYEWSNGETGNSITITPTADMTISVIPSNACTGEATELSISLIELPTTTVTNSSFEICEGATLTLLASGGDSYFWNTGSTSAEMTIAPTISTNYTVTAYNGSCAGNTEEIEVLVNAAPYAGPSTEVDFCSTEGSQNLFDYLIAADEDGQWYDTDANPFNGMLSPATGIAGDYLYVVSGLGDCEDASTTLTVNINQQPNAGSSTSISVSSSADEMDLMSYLDGADEDGTWTDPNGSSFDGYFDPTSDMEGAYVYSFTADAPCNTSSAIVSISVTETSNAGQNTSVYFCSSDGESNLFPLLTDADAGGNWSSPSGGDFNGILNPQEDASGTYTYSIGESSADIVVTINETPEPIISMEEGSFEINTPISFSNSGTLIGNTAWNFGDDGMSTELNPEHSYSVEGFYTVSLDLENNGCQGHDELGIIVLNTATGITEEFIDQQLLIYPNPGFGIFNLRFDLGKEHSVRYDVINSNGKLLSTSGFENVSNAEYRINLIAQSSGYYFVRFYVDDIVVTKKLLKTN